MFVGYMRGLAKLVKSQLEHDRIDNDKSTSRRNQKAH
jgi:hypothetical protein